MFNINFANILVFIEGNFVGFYGLHGVTGIFAQGTMS